MNDVTEGAVVAFDTELFGHHWHEGVTFLERVLELADVVPVGVEIPLPLRSTFHPRAGAPAATCAPGARPRRAASRGPSVARN